MRKCLLCLKMAKIEGDQYQFCDFCAGQLERLEIDLAQAEIKLKE